MLKEILKLIKPKSELQIDSFLWFEKGRWIAEVIKCKSNKRMIYVDSYFDEETENYIIEYYIK